MQRTTGWLLVGYFLALSAAGGGMYFARGQTLSSLDNAEAVAEWREWQEETKRQAAHPTGPVKRREAKAQEPPMLILMRDHFPAAVLTTLLAVTIFYWFFVLTIRGSMNACAPDTSTAVPRGATPRAGGEP
ncbi:MAG: hypothetical protein QM775_21705 [Pirellulales bacterium]